MHDARWIWEALLKAVCIQLFCGIRRVIVTLTFRRIVLVSVCCEWVVLFIYLA